MLKFWIYMVIIFDIYSLDGIIVRYKKEEIVEGYRLVTPVVRVRTLCIMMELSLHLNSRISLFEVQIDY